MQYGHRIAPGSKRPEGAPPTIRKNLSKKEKAQKYRDLCSQGPKVIIDCEFSKLMVPKEQLSLA